MRQLFHPKVEDITVEAILHAFCDPIRMHIFMTLAKAECAQNCSTFLSVNKAKLPKSTLSQHFKILREAGLIYSERSGVELNNRTRCKELEKRFGGMLKAIIGAYTEQQKKAATRKPRR